MKRMKHDVEAILADSINRSETPCISVLLYQDGEEVLFQMAGFANIGANKPIARDSIFRLYSLSKPMTAVAAMTLVERGKMDIIAPVSDFLEGFKDQRVAVGDTGDEPVKRPVQIRDLFTMTSGLPYPGENTPAERTMTAFHQQMEQDIKEGKPLSTVSIGNAIGKLPLAFQPGEAFLYGTSADILGAVIEVISGKTLDEYMTEVIFEPLGMEDTGFFVPDQKQSRIATLYEHTDGGLREHPENATRHGVFSLPNFLEGGAGIFSTLDDTMRFGQMLLQDGKLKKTRILSKNSVSWLSHNHLNAKQHSCFNGDSVLGCGYGGLMRVMLSPTQSFSLSVKGEFGWDGWTGTYLTVCPEKDLILVVMQQLADAGTNAPIRKIRNVLYAGI